MIPEVYDSVCGFPLFKCPQKISQSTKMVEMSPPRSVQIKTSKALGF